MKAIIQCELICSCCKRPMQWSTAVDIVAGERIETDYVACRSLKCKERNVRYQQPTVELVSFQQDAKNKAEVEAYLEEQEREDVAGLDQLEGESVQVLTDGELKPKRKYTRKAKA